MITFPHKDLNPCFNFDLHDGIFFQPPPSVHIQAQAWHLGASIMLLASSKDRKDNQRLLYIDGRPALSQKHRVKDAVLPHSNVAPFTQPNLLSSSLAKTSESRCEFAATSVQGPDGPLAVSVFGNVGFNLACAEPVMMPTSLVVNWGSVQIGFNWSDLLASLVAVALDIIANHAQFLLGEAIGASQPRTIAKALALRIADKIGLNSSIEQIGPRGPSPQLVGQALGAMFAHLLDKGWAPIGSEIVLDFIKSRSETF